MLALHEMLELSFDQGRRFVLDQAAGQRVAQRLSWRVGLSLRRLAPSGLKVIHIEFLIFEINFKF